MKEPDEKAKPRWQIAAIVAALGALVLIIYAFATSRQPANDSSSMRGVFQGGTPKDRSIDWVIEAFTTESDWTAGLPSTLGKSAADVDCAAVIQQSLRLELRGKSVSAQLTKHQLTPEELRELLNLGLTFLVQGNVEKLSLSTEDGQPRGTLEVFFRLRKAKGLEERELSTVQAGRVKTDCLIEGTSPDREELMGLCESVAEKIAERVVREAVSNLMSARG